MTWKPCKNSQLVGSPTEIHLPGGNVITEQEFVFTPG
jgi:hypothetical protein